MISSQGGAPRRAFSSSMVTFSRTGLRISARPGVCGVPVPSSRSFAIRGSSAVGRAALLDSRRDLLRQQPKGLLVPGVEHLGDKVLHAGIGELPEIGDGLLGRAGEERPPPDLVQPAGEVALDLPLNGAFV